MAILKNAHNRLKNSIKTIAKPDPVNADLLEEQQDGSIPTNEEILQDEPLNLLAKLNVSLNHALVISRSIGEQALIKAFEKVEPQIQKLIAKEKQRLHAEKISAIKIKEAKLPPKPKSKK